MNQIRNNTNSLRKNSRMSNRRDFRSVNKPQDSGFGHSARSFRTQVKIRQEEFKSRDEFIKNNHIRHQQRDRVEKQFMSKDEIVRLRSGIRKILKSDVSSKIKNKGLLNKFSSGYGISTGDYLKIKNILNKRLKDNPKIFDFSERQRFKQTLNKISKNSIDKAVMNINTEAQQKLDEEISEIKKVEKRVDSILKEVDKIRDKRTQNIDSQSFNDNKDNKEKGSNQGPNSDSGIDDIEKIRDKAKDLPI